MRKKQLIAKYLKLARKSGNGTAIDLLERMMIEALTNKEREIYKYLKETGGETTTRETADRFNISIQYSWNILNDLSEYELITPGEGEPTELIRWKIV